MRLATLRSVRSQAGRILMSTLMQGQPLCLRTAAPAEPPPEKHVEKDLPVGAAAQSLTQKEVQALPKRLA